MDTTTVLNQLQHLLPLREFSSFTRQYRADRYVKRFSCKDQLTVLLYAQATGKDSLREIETGLKMWDSKWYHLGLRTVARSTLARANELRPWEIYESLFYELLKKCQSLTSGTASFAFDNPLYALDSTTVDLCLSLFPWAHFHHTKGAIKLHALFNVRSQIPEVISVTDGRTADVTELQMLDLERLPTGSIFVVDRAYIDYSELNRINRSGDFFVVRLKDNAQIVPLEPYPISESGVLKDQRIGFVLPGALEDYPDDLRLVTYHDDETNKTYRFLTNNFLLSAKTVADVYKARWQIEIFFKWIKQHLKIKTFLGTSANAVLTQIWVAMIYFLLVSWLKFQTKFSGSLLELTRMVAEVLLQQVSVIDILRLTPKTLPKALARASPIQMALL